MYKQYIIVLLLIFFIILSITTKSKAFSNKIKDKNLYNISLINSKKLSKKIINKKLYYIRMIENDHRSYRNNRDIDYDKLYSIIKLHFRYNYVWGAESFKEGGFDCSGFIYHIFKMYGEPIPRTTSSKYYILFKRKIHKWDLSNTGDLVWFTFSNRRPYGHIGIILKPIIDNRIKFVYFAQSGASTGPIISIFKINGYWDRHFTACKIGLK